MFGLAASTVPYMFWFLALLAICGLLYYKMKQAASQVSHSGERASAPRLPLWPPS